MTHITVRTPIGVATPRGVAVLPWLLRQWALINRHLALAYAQRAKTKATQAAIEDANKLRAFAANVARSEPGFAADLFAAADRHEGLSG